jgi:phenylacetate-CoA oxygenase/reductase PaaK subunit
MSSSVAALPPSRHALPDPGEPVPRLALPTFAIFTVSLGIWIASTVAALNDSVPAGVTIALNAAVSFVMFTVLHDASHYSLSSTRWVNGLFGRLSVMFVVGAASFPTFGYIHIEHHRHSNDDANDPDTWASHGPWWQLPFRWITIDLWYGRYYFKHARSRPRAEVLESLALTTLFLGVIAACIATGHFTELAIIYLIPQRIALLVLAWWFDWLPHHGLQDTQRENRYRATRNRVGMEWLYTPLMLSQNYHLVHHLHPSIPFYRYMATWRRNEEAYLERNAAIGTVFGQQLSPDEYLEWKRLNSKLYKLLPVRTPKGSAAPHAVFHEVPVADVRRLTDDSVLITFDVPEALRDEFRFEAGQHLTVRTDLGGEGVRRNYSICSPATAGELRIAVKHIPGGAFSTFALQQLKPGDTLELLTPTGRFGTPLDPLHTKHYGAIVAGSGITPVLSLIATTLEIETESRFTLIYANRTRASTMFAEELDEFESRWADRLEIVHVRSRVPHRDALQTGRIDDAKLSAWLDGRLRPDDVDEWFLCGPVDLVTLTRDKLLASGVETERVHLELFYGYKDAAAGGRPNARPASLTFTLSGRDETVQLNAGDSLLEGALRTRGDAPYACMGGACGTCRAKLVSGDVEMDQNFALGQTDLDAGYILTCQSHATTDTVVVDYDA